GPVGNTVPNTDQRGKPRVGVPDIGAYESPGFTLSVNNTGDGTANTLNCETGNTNACRLRDAIAVVTASAASGTTITFAPAVFPAATPATITVDQSAGTLTLGTSMTIDGSGAGVIVD